MLSVPTRLNLAQRQLASATTNLELALQRAAQFSYPPNYIAAIKKAIADNQATWLHVGNIATVLSRRPDPHLQHNGAYHEKP